MRLPIHADPFISRGRLCYHFFVGSMNIEYVYQFIAEPTPERYYGLNPRKLLHAYWTFNEPRKQGQFMKYAFYVSLLRETLFRHVANFHITSCMSGSSKLDNSLQLYQNFICDSENRIQNSIIYGLLSQNFWVTTSCHIFWDTRAVTHFGTLVAVTNFGTLVAVSISWHTNQENRLANSVL